MVEREWCTRRSTSTRYRVGDRSLAELREWLEPLPDRVPLIVDADVWDLHGEAIRSALAPCEPLALKIQGEQDKELHTVDRLVSELVGHRVHRREKLVCVGGGVCCDVGGLVALVYMRGMDYAIVATSLMAQVDAAIGGKVGCNVGTRKNLVGGFHHPGLVLLDPGFIATLPTRCLRAGLAEAVKLGVVLPDLEILSLLDDFEERNPTDQANLVARCLEGKLRLLDPDPFEGDLDRLLNLGHAVAHALEKVAGADVLHGEAVAIGLAATAHYAEREGHCTPAHRRRIISLLKRLCLPTEAEVDLRDLSSRLAEIPDHRGGELRLVVPAGDSGACIVGSADTNRLAECVSPTQISA